MYKEYNHLLDAYYHTVNYISRYGIEEITEDGEHTLTLEEPITIKIEHPTTSTNFPYGMGSQAADIYSYQMKFPIRDSGFSYTYGLRLRDYNGVDQIQQIVNRLNENPNSRRAVASLYDPMIDSTGDEIPCMNHIQFRIVNDKLNCYVVFRSHDMLSAWFMNCYAISSLMDLIRSNLKGWVEKGCLYITSNSPHIYDVRDKDVLNKVLKELEIMNRRDWENTEEMFRAE